MIRLLPLILALLASLPARAQIDPDGQISSQATLYCESSTIAAGATFTLALHLDHPDGWHSYYLNSGGLEQPPEIQWTLPEGFSAGPIQWPVPTAKQSELGTSFIYPGSVSLLVDITAPSGLEIGSNVTLKADAYWQICEVGCIPEEGSFEIQLPVAESTSTNPATTDFFSQARGKLPRSSTTWNFSARDEGEAIALRFNPGASFGDLPTDFIPNQPFVKSASSGGSIAREGDDIVIRLPRATKDAFGDAIPQGETLSGIVVGQQESALMPQVRIDHAATSPKATSTRKAVSVGTLLPILGGMFLGGLILNLMPCVFPVIGLKIMGFVQQAGEDRKKIILHGLTFTGGVVASFAVLSGILFAARSAAGEAVGWGYQLQNPWVVLSLMILMFLLALNMFGVFEIGASATSIGGSLQSKQGFAGSFFSGVLATVVATPCSAPFLGAAIGAAIALPALSFFTAFGAMALGLSAPYLVLSIFPKLIDLLPRPGAWMESFKQGMSFLLFATAGYLLWVYAGQIDLDHLLGPIFGLSAIGIAAWIHGRWNVPSREKRTRGIALALTIAFAIGGIFLAKPPKPSALEWQTWSAEKVEQLLEEGTPVYIDFTAKWCATCQVNKKRAYTPEVIALMHQKGVVALKADKTKPNPDIDEAIADYGRAAIPVNVLLISGKDPLILPELLSPDDLLQALKMIEDR